MYYDEVPQYVVDALAFYDKAMEVDEDAERRMLLAEAISRIGQSTPIKGTMEIHFAPLMKRVKGEEGDRTQSLLGLSQIRLLAQYGNYPPETTEKIVQFAALITEYNQ